MKTTEHYLQATEPVEPPRWYPAGFSNSLEALKVLGEQLKGIGLRVRLVKTETEIVEL